MSKFGRFVNPEVGCLNPCPGQCTALFKVPRAYGGYASSPKTVTVLTELFELPVNVAGLREA
jgi:hypothetical protein